MLGLEERDVDFRRILFEARQRESVEIVLLNAAVGDIALLTHSGARACRIETRLQQKRWTMSNVSRNSAIRNISELGTRHGEGNRWRAGLLQ